MKMVLRRAVVHSQKAKGLQDVLISDKPAQDGQYRAEVNGKLCTAIYNVFVGHYYVDDIYGVIKDYEGTYRVVDYYERPEVLGHCETKDKAKAIADQRDKDTDGECQVYIEKMIGGYWTNV